MADAVQLEMIFTPEVCHLISFVVFIINDTLARNELGIKPLIPHIERIEAIQSKADLQPYLEENIRLGGYALFGFGVSADAKDSNKNVAPRHFFSIIRIMLQRSKVGIYRVKA